MKRRCNCSCHKKKKKDGLGMMAARGFFTVGDTIIEAAFGQAPGYPVNKPKRCTCGARRQRR